MFNMCEWKEKWISLEKNPYSVKRVLCQLSMLRILDCRAAFAPKCCSWQMMCLIYTLVVSRNLFPGKELFLDGRMLVEQVQIERWVWSGCWSSLASNVSKALDFSSSWLKSSYDDWALSDSISVGPSVQLVSQDTPSSASFPSVTAQHTCSLVSSSLLRVDAQVHPDHPPAYICAVMLPWFYNSVPIWSFLQ